jgi:demethylmenaquinone methyltransferase/2-methoxy-6-polyprenyl-1,4-benzoquinol methylase
MKAEDAAHWGWTMEKEIRDYYSLQKKFWGIFAPFYDVFEVFSRRIRGKVVALADAKKGSKILDVATGTGKQAFAFAKEGYDVIGVDLSEAMLATARRKNAYPNASFEQGDATRLRFRDRKSVV